jgi:8-oxo-dGTP pyrophosphatase MutT (NUDIX family)
VVAEVALITAYDSRGRLLLGRRNDNDLWTLPAGHLQEGESPADAAKRELSEETGLEAKSLSPLTTYALADGTVLHCFSAFVTGEPHGANDPDHEVDEWKFVEVGEGLPKRIANKLAGPKDLEQNLLLRLFHLEKALQKADDEIGRLLEHPNPYERSMALLLGGVGARHLTVAALDEDPEVHQRALMHPGFDENLALTLMFAPRATAAQLSFLAQPERVRPEHLEALYQTSCDSPDAAALHTALVSHPILEENLARRIYADPRVDFKTRLALMQHPVVPEDVHRNAIQVAFMFPFSGQPVELAKIALLHARTPQALVEDVVRMASQSDQPGLHDMANHALVSRPVSSNLIHEILRVGKMRPGPLYQRLRSSAVSNPAATPEHLDELMKDRDPELLRALVKSPRLESKHIDAVLNQLLAGSPRDEDSIRALIEHPRFGYHHYHQLLQTLQKSAASNLFDAAAAVEASIVQDMLGFQPALSESFQAARFLAGGDEIPFEGMRRALYQHEDDLDAAALSAYGFELNDQNRAALRAVRTLPAVKKSEPVAATATEVLGGSPEAADVAEALKRAFADGFVFPVKLGGKHSAGSLLAHDSAHGKTWLLKPGSGGQSPAAGAAQDPSTQSAREAAWYHIAQSWDLSAWFPRAELVLIDGRQYAALELLPWSFKTIEKRKTADPALPRRVLQRFLADGTLHKWAILDYVLGNPDRHGQNVMVDDDGSVKLIDHGSAFAGNAFDPAHDQDSFIPFYLRAWAPDKFADLTPTQKLARLPRVSAQVAAELRGWLFGLRKANLAVIATRFGVDVAPELARLARLRALAVDLPVDEAINRLWVAT